VGTSSVAGLSRLVGTPEAMTLTGSVLSVLQQHRNALQDRWADKVLDGTAEGTTWKARFDASGRSPQSRFSHAEESAIF
jgi:hypothetical protein